MAKIKPKTTLYYVLLISYALTPWIFVTILITFSQRSHQNSSIIYQHLLINFGVDGNLFKNFYREKGIQPGALKLTKVNTDFVAQELSSLNSQKATGLDGIAPEFLKDSASIISPVVTHIINLSIATGKVPDELKLAKVTPLYKKLTSSTLVIIDQLVFLVFYQGVRKGNSISTSMKMVWFTNISQGFALVTPLRHVLST